MRKGIILFSACFLAVLLASCDPCPYHSHDRVEIVDEGFSVSTIDSIGDLLTLQDAEWVAENGQFVLSVDYGIVNRDVSVSVYVDGIEIGTMGTDITFSMADTEKGRDFTFPCHRDSSPRYGYLHGSRFIGTRSGGSLYDHLRGK